MTSQPSGRRRFDILYNALLALFGVVSGILLSELLARGLYGEPWYDQLVNEQRKSEKGNYGKGYRGLRDREYSVVKAPGIRRVLMLGDSVTFGQGVFDESKIFTEVLESSLDNVIEGVDSVEVLNGGIPGSVTSEWVQRVKRTRKFFQHDVVVIVFFLRDGTRTHSMGGFFGPIRTQIVQRNQSSEWYRKVYLYRVIQGYIDKKMVAEEYTQAIVQAYIGDEEQTAEWELAKRNIKEIAQVAEQDSAATGIVIFPILVGLHRNYPFQQVCDKIEEFAAENAIPVHSLLPDFMGLNAPDLWVGAYDQHPNAEAHRIAAESMFPFIRELLRSSEKMSRASGPEEPAAGDPLGKRNS